MTLMKTLKLKAPVAIVGGGFAGLTAAQTLKQQGIPFDLYEAGKQIAGLCQTFKDEDGFSYDFGTHLITNRLAAELGVESQCLDVKYFGETVLLKGRHYSYPFGLMRVPRYSLSALRNRLFGMGRKLDNAADYFRGTLGSEIADDVAIPLIEGVMGQPATDLAPSVGDKLPGVAQTVFLRLASRLTRKAIAIGYCQDLPETPSVWHTYPMGGIGILCNKLAEGLDENIRLESRVEKIIVESERVVAVRVNGETREASAVISSAPVNILAKLVEGSDTINHLSEFKYSPMIFVNLRLEGRKLLPDVVLWTPESKFPFFRLQEASTSMPWLTPEGKTLITADISCKVGDEYWTMTDDELGQMCLRNLESIIPNVSQRYLGCRVLRTRIAYPTLLKSYEPARKRLAQGTGIERLISVGRNGEFAHILLEDLYHRTVKKTQRLIEELEVMNTFSHGKEKVVSYTS
ncbi:MAG: NAD(P)/FAD-dependent oxidoreductase [Prochloraceae cyanobacterium]